MRSCFVPNCDVLCKNMTKRMMFIPPKNQELFNTWKTVLPNRRDLKPTDRVCERHFHTDDICKTFDHIINGVLHQIDRGKPKLRATAVPIFNLPTDDIQDLKRKHEGGETTHRKSKKHHGIGNDIPKLIVPDELTKMRRPIIKRLMKDFSDKRTKENNAVQNTYNEINENIEGNIILEDVNSTTDDHVKEHSSIILQETSYILPEEEEEEPCSYTMNSNQRTDLETTEVNYDCVDATLFDGIYEDIYEVTLPNTLWGIHRDPNRTFIVFSYFDDKTCSTSKLIHLDNRMNTHIYIKGKIVNTDLCNLSIEYLTNLVSQVDEYRICEKFDSNSKCEVVAVDQNLCTACQ